MASKSLGTGRQINIMLLLCKDMICSSIIYSQTIACVCVFVYQSMQGCETAYNLAYLKSSCSILYDKLCFNAGFYAFFLQITRTYCFYYKRNAFLLLYFLYICKIAKVQPLSKNKAALKSIDRSAQHFLKSYWTF